MPQSIVEQVRSALQRSALVVTANERAARTLRGLAGAGADNIPLSWNAWVSSMWTSLLVRGEVDRVPLGQEQQIRLWTRLLTADTEHTALRDVHALAEVTARSASLAMQWGVQEQVHPRTAGQSTDAATFARWFVAMQRRVGSDGCLPQQMIPDALREAVERGRWKPVQHEMLLVGFDRLLPAQEKLLQALTNAGVKISHARLEERETPPEMLTCEDETDEGTQCALWAAALLEKSPETRIAIVVPDMESARPKLERALREHVSPEWNDIAGRTDRALYEFSLGVPLRSLEMVRSAIRLLRWTASPLPLAQVEEIFHSPYFGSEEGATARSEFATFELRQAPSLTHTVRIDEVRSLLLKNEDRPALRSTADLLRSLQEASRRMTPRAWPAWAEAIREMLAAVGWPARSLDSLEFQIRARWTELLDAMTALGISGEQVPFTLMLETLERMAERTLFAPESHDAPIQVMSPMEAAGCTFDALWLLHADDLRWPQSASADSLLPYFLQKQHGMPGAEEAADIALADAVTRRLLSSATVVIASYAQHREDGAGRPSALLQRAATWTQRGTIEIPTSAFTVDLEAMEEPVAQLPLNTDQRSVGGVGVLESQAACAFQAFARWRLYSDVPSPKGRGMDAMDRGNLTHEALEYFWREVKTQARLAELANETIDADGRTRLDETIERVVHAVSPRTVGTDWERAYLSIEQERLCRLLRDWMDRELARAPFAVMDEGLERKVEAHIGPLHLQVRVDRIDRVSTPEGDALVLIDYKTGACSDAQWKSDRPEKPQLPLYAVSAEMPEGSPKVEGIAFASVVRGEKSGFKSVASYDRIFTPRQKANDFEAAVTEWHSVLELLATEFAAGHMEVSPKKYPTTCRYCQQRLICRVRSDDFDTEDTDEANEENES